MKMMTAPSRKAKTMNSTELLPCPFCGGHARPMKCKVGIEGTMGCNKWVTITCSMCEINNGGKGGFMRPRYDTEEEAAKAWNTRASTPAPVERIDHLKTALMNAVTPFYEEDKAEWVLYCGGKESAVAILQAARAYLKLQGGE